MRTKIIKLGIVSLFFTVLLSSCAKELMVNYQPDSYNTGKVIIKPTGGNLQGVVITANDNLLVEDGRAISKVTINNVPVGEYHLELNSDSWKYKEKIHEKYLIKMGLI